MKHLGQISSKLGPKGSQSAVSNNNEASSLFKVQKTIRYGLPFEPTTLAYDPIQKVIAVGSKSGDIRLYGKPGVETYVCHEEGRAIKHLFFSVNEGALVSVTVDDCLHLWNLRQRAPQVVQSLLFKRESLCVCKLPLFTKWIYLGTEKGNIFVVNLETFDLSGYQIMWNQTIPKSQKVHPGPVTALEEHPVDPSKLLIGYENGRLVIWDLKSKEVIKSYCSDRPLSCVYWMSDVKQFISGHIEGSLAIWNFNTTRVEEKPVKSFKPHEFHKEASSPQPCNLITKVMWLSTKTDPVLIFNGGVPGPNSSHYITIFHGRKRESFNLEKPIVDFAVVCASPYAKDIQDPSVVFVLLCDDIIAIDLTSHNFTQYPAPYGVTVGISPVTHLSNYPSCPTSLLEDLQLCHQQSPMKYWPIDGGELGRPVENNYDLSVTGHKDGSLQFWDVSGVTLQHLHTLQTRQFFDGKQTTESGESLVSVTHVNLCLSGRTLVIAYASSQILILSWNNTEVLQSLSVIPVLLAQPDYAAFEFDSMEEENTSPGDSPKTPGVTEQSEEQKRASHLLSKFGIEMPNSGPSNADDGKTEPMLGVITGDIKQYPGFQTVLGVQCISHANETPGQITCVELSSAWGLVAFGSSLGVVIVDYIQKCLLWSASNSDLLNICYPNMKIPLSYKASNSKSKKFKVTKLGSFNNAEEENLRSRKGTQRGKMLSIIRRDKAAESPTSLNSHKKARKQGSGGSIDSPNSPSSIASDTDVAGGPENYIESFLVQRVCFVESFTDKDIAGNLTAPRRNPTLWIGSYSGALLSQTINIPPGEHRTKIPCQVGSGGSPAFLKSPIINISALDNEGNPVSPPAAIWHDETRKKKGKVKRKERDVLMNESDLQSNDYLVVAAEKSILILKLPSQNSYARQKVFDNTYYLKSQVLTLEGWGICMACVSIMGYLSFYTLPQLKPLVNVPWFDAKDSRSLRTFTSSSNGHSMYMCSPTELQAMSLINRNHLMLPESLSMVFTMREPPEPPRKGFLNMILKRNSVDRSELFGTNSGPISPGLTEKILRRYEPLQQCGSEINKVKEALNERSEKINEISQKTEQMKMEAENFASASHLLHQRVKEQNKWF
ncbi:syntaxin-binding protein 5-like [Bolinopsis microptera]|uniref:syntaxin-binding protein 5-like n=1 Tax=Bolinopsis microptera TaxID=2820187 RepID=UPI003078C764